MEGPRLDSTQAYEILAGAKPPAGIRVAGSLDYSAKSKHRPPSRLPESLSVDVLDLSGSEIEELPAGLRCYELNLSNTAVRTLPDDLQVEMRIDLRGCNHLERLPPNLTVGSLNLNGCVNLTSLPEGLDVWFLDLTSCWAFDGWPSVATVRGGRLILRGCTALTSLPAYVTRLAELDVRDCPNLKSLPPDLVVTGRLDLARSGLTEESLLPPGLARTQLRWAGVNIDRRIAFHPETLQVDEVLAESNAERRRMLLDRYGYGRFLTDADAEILDRDTDPGGPRQLVRVKLPGDEDLVALSCCCPSTGRRYMIRVPPATKGCHQAAAWIAGFDDPSEYQPVQET